MKNLFIKKLSTFHYDKLFYASILEAQNLKIDYINKKKY